MFDRTVNHFKIKYTDLGKYFGIGTFNRKYVNVFINLECVLKQMSKRYFLELGENFSSAQKVQTVYEVISQLFNLAGHYRSYFRSNKIFSNIFFYYGDFDKRNYNNTIHLEDYRKSYKSRYDFDRAKSEPIISIIRVALEMFSKFIQYTDSMFIVKSDKVEPSVIPYLIMNMKGFDKGVNFIVTEDEYDFQYVIHNGIILYPKGESEKVFTKINMISYIVSKYSIEKIWEDDINYRLIPLLYTFAGFKDRDIPKLPRYGMKKIYKQMEKLYKNDLVDDDNPDTFLIESIGEFIKDDMFLLGDSPRTMIGNNYFSIDIQRQADVCNEYDINTIKEQLVENYDIKALKILNDTSFDHYDCPIIIDSLAQYISNNFLE